MTTPLTLPALIAGAALALLPAIGLANCTASNDRNDYQGTIAGTYKIGMSLTFSNPEVGGEYFYTSQRKNIALRGTVQDETRIKLEERDKNDIATADFDLTASKDCGVLQGVWRKRDTHATLPVLLTLSGAGSGGVEHRYSQAGADDDALVNREAVKFWLGVKEGDKKAVAAQIRYPVKATVAGRKTQLKNSAELIANYDVIFTKAYRDLIVSAVPHNMFSNWQGIMLGNGQVWFNEKGQVIALNN